MKEKRVSDSASVLTHLPMPDETNASGTIHGGYVFKHIDDAGGLAAQRHSQTDVVTASIEYMDYLTPVRPGEIMILKSSVNMAGRTSMSVGVRLEVEDPNSKILRHAGTCYMVYVAVDKGGRPVEVPALVIEGETEERRYQKARIRRELGPRLRGR